MGRRQRLGEWGETVAVRYLARRGYEVLRRKWRCAAGEVDIVARHNGVLIFVEVRTRSGNDPGMAAELITAAKRARLITLAGMFLRVSPSSRRHALADRYRGNCCRIIRTGCFD